MRRSLVSLTAVGRARLAPRHGAHRRRVVDDRARPRRRPLRRLSLGCSRRTSTSSRLLDSGALWCRRSGAGRAPRRSNSGWHALTRAAAPPVRRCRRLLADADRTAYLPAIRSCRSRWRSSGCTGGAAAVPRFWMTVLLAGLRVLCVAALAGQPSAGSDGRLTRSGARQRERASCSRASVTTGRRFRAVTSPCRGRRRWPCARVWPAAGLVLAVIALGVSVGAAAGRYHYVIDVLLGVVVAVVAVVIT